MEKMIRVSMERMVVSKDESPDGCLLPFITKFVTWRIIRRNMEVNRAKIAQNLPKIWMVPPRVRVGPAVLRGEMEPVRVKETAPSPAKGL